MLFALKIPTKIARYTRHTQQQQIAAWQRICHARRPLKSRRHGTSFSPAKPQNKTLWSGIPIIPSIDGHRHLGPIPRPPTSPAWISIPEGRIRPRLLRRHRILANHRSPSCNFAVKLIRCGTGGCHRGKALPSRARTSSGKFARRTRFSSRGVFAPEFRDLHFLTDGHATLCSGCPPSPARGPCGACRSTAVEST